MSERSYTPVKGALSGTHLCLKHQGNYSHYAKDNCEICTLKRELSAMTAQLAEARTIAGVQMDGWNYNRPQQDNKDARKFVTLKNGAMRWTGVRAWHHQGQYWMNNGEPCKEEIVVAWRDLPEPADGFWLNGVLHIPRSAK